VCDWADGALDFQRAIRVCQANGRKVKPGYEVEPGMGSAHGSAVSDAAVMLARIHPFTIQ